MGDGTPGPPDAGKIAIKNARFPIGHDDVPYPARPIAVDVRVLWQRASIDPYEEWIPAVAARWTATHVCVHVTDSRSYWPEFWVLAEDVRRRPD
jgi:hypothetical protein